MKKIVHDLGLDVHKESIAVSIAPQNSSEVRRYRIIQTRMQISREGTKSAKEDDRRAPPAARNPTRAHLKSVNERKSRLLCWWAIRHGGIVLTRCGWSSGHSRAPQTPRLGVSAVNNPSPPSPLRAQHLFRLMG